MRRMHQLIELGSQFVISTHSPILLGYPGATIYLLSEDGMRATRYEDVDVVSITRSFLDDREVFFHHLFADHD